MREPWVWKRLAVLLCASMLINGVRGWLTYVEDDQEV